MELRQFDKIEATYQPIRTDDLQEGAAAFIGRRAVWQASWVIEEGPYAGQWAMAVWDHEWPFAWTPLCDLADCLAYVGRMDEQESV